MPAEAVATVTPWLDVILFALATAGFCWVACELCWRAEEHERDDVEAWRRG